jgi:hypothetical protein
MAGGGGGCGGGEERAEPTARLAHARKKTNMFLFP